MELLEIVNEEYFSWLNYYFILFVFGVTLLTLLFKRLLAVGEPATNHRNNYGKDERKRINEIIMKYGLTEKGFLPDSCLQRLTDYYKEWEGIASRLPELNKTGKFKNEIAKMKLLNCDDLVDEAMLRRAYIILGMFVHSYVNGDKVVWKEKDGLIIDVGNSNNPIKHEDDDVIKTTINLTDIQKLPRIPPQLAIPWYQVCRKLDMPFVLTAALDLWNWILKDDAKSHDLENLSTITTMTGTESETYFHMVPCAMQFVAGGLIPQMFLLYDGIANDERGKIMNKNDSKGHGIFKANKVELESIDENIISFLNDLTYVFQKFKEIARKIKHFVDVNVFYDVYRPFLGGFWPDGIVLDLSQKDNQSNNDKAVCDGYDDDDDDVLTVDDGNGHENATERHAKEAKGSLKTKKSKEWKKTQMVGLEERTEHLDEIGMMPESCGASSGMKQAGIEADTIGTDNADLVPNRNERISEPICFKQRSLSAMSPNDQVKSSALNDSYPRSSACDGVIKAKLPNGAIIVNPKGPSAGQSTMIFLFDSLLGIKHKRTGKEFQDEMINYIPLRHRQIVYDLRDLIERFGSLRHFIVNSGYSPRYKKLVFSYNECVQAVADFRSLHLGIAVKYLVRTEKGTGSSTFRDMLNEMVSATRMVKIPFDDEKEL